MALYPGNAFTSFGHPATMQSVFEDFNELFSDALLHPFGGARPKRRRAAQHHRHFTAVVRIGDFRPDEVSVKVEERKVRVHAKHQEGEDDVNEVRKTVHLPEDADAEKVETRLTKEGFLVVRAPYQRSEKATVSASADAASSQEAQADWQQLRQLLRGPGITDLREQLVKDEDGVTKFRVPVPVRDFHPEEVSVKQIGDRIVVSAEHKEERDGQLVQRSLCREFTLPQGVDAERLVSRYGEDGLLTIEAPAPSLQMPEPKEIVVERPQAEQQ